jgi:hypothetical protein
MKATKLILLLVVLLWPAVLCAEGFHVVRATTVCVDFWGKLTIKGQPPQAGDQVGVFDPQGVCCGVATVTPESAAVSIYPFVHAYGDDSTTSGVDEGATDGDLLTFKVYRAKEDRIYGLSVVADVQSSDAPNPPQWVAPLPGLPGLYPSWQVDLYVLELWDIPGQSIPFGSQFQPIDLNDYLAEPSDADWVTWSVQAEGTNLQVSLTDGHIMTVWAPVGWSGSEKIKVSGRQGTELFSQEVTYTVGANTAPQFVSLPGAQVVDEGATLVFDVTASDADGNALTFTLGGNIRNATLTPLPPSGGTYKARISFKPDFDQSGSYGFVVTVSDGYLQAQGTVPVTVNDVTGATVETGWDLVPGTDYQLTVSGTGTALDGLKINIPKGALSQPVHLTASLIDPSLLPPLPQVPLGVPFHLGPNGLTFNVPITIIAPYSQDPVEKNISAYWFGEGVSGWSTQGITGVSPDFTARTVTFQASQLGSFTMAASAQPAVTPEGPVAAEAGGGGGGWCFIATAAFGSPLERHVADLRRFRDRWLLTSVPGRLIVEAYYALGPAAADYIRRNPSLRGPVRLVLYPLAALASLATGSLPPLGLSGLLLASGCTAVLVRRRRRTV